MASIGTASGALAVLLHLILRSWRKATDIWYTSIASGSGCSNSSTRDCRRTRSARRSRHSSSRKSASPTGTASSTRTSKLTGSKSGGRNATGGTPARSLLLAEPSSHPNPLRNRLTRFQFCIVCNVRVFCSRKSEG